MLNLALTGFVFTLFALGLRRPYLLVLADLYVECRSWRTGQGHPRQSLGAAFGPAALRGSSCSGFRPWLWDRESGCTAEIRTLQRGASNVHFPVVCSAPARGQPLVSA